MNEIWKSIEGYLNYQVSNMGRVKSLNYNRTGEEKIMKNSKDKDGYLFVRLYKEGKEKTHKVHRLVAQAFISNPNNYPVINHKNELKDDNRVENLEWCSIAYNNTYNNKIAKCYKPVLQYSIDGKLIGKLDSLKEFGKPHNAISNCLRGNRKSAYGYIWRYYDEILYLESLLLDRFNIKNKRVA